MSEILSTNLLQEISLLIDSTRTHTARFVNSSLIFLYWNIGTRIHDEILKKERGDYGEQVIKELAEKLTVSYGRGFSPRGLFRMVRFAKLYPDEQIVTTLSPLLSWSHIRELISFDDEVKRQFYTEMCRLEHWTVRELQKKINGMLFERTAISQQPENVIQESLGQLKKQNEFTKEIVFRDPYILDFLELPAKYSESNLENAIINELGQFLQEMGSDFCFIARQKRISIDHEDYYIDLLMYHRGLKRLIAIELKLGKFTASHKGQMELYLRWLDKYERRMGEERPLGIILCSEKRQEHVELLELDKSGIHVAQYITTLLPLEVLESKLKRAVEIGREKYARCQENENQDQTTVPIPCVP